MKYLEILIQFSIMYVMISWIISLNEKGKLIVAVVYTFAVIMTFFAVEQMAPIQSCGVYPQPADPIKCAMIFFTPWVVVCLMQLWINGKMKLASRTSSNQ